MNKIYKLSLVFLLTLLVVALQQENALANTDSNIEVTNFTIVHNKGTFKADLKEFPSMSKEEVPLTIKGLTLKRNKLALDYISEKVNSGSKIVLKDIAFNRNFSLDAELWVDGVNIGQELLDKGLAQDMETVFKKRTRIMVILNVSILIVTLIIVLVVFRMANKKHSKITPVSKMPPYMHETLKCPKCSQDMSGGYVPATKPIIWLENKDDKVGAFGSMKKVVENTFSIPIRQKDNRAWRCSECKFILLDHSTLIDRRK